MKRILIFQKLQGPYSRYIETLTEEQRKKIIAYLYISLTLFTVSFFGLCGMTPTLSTIANLGKQYEDNKLGLDSLNKRL